MRSLRRAPLLFVLALIPWLAGAGCPTSSSAHHGAWVANEPDGVLFYQFDKNGGVVVTIEIYTTNPLLDGMKLEMSMTCKPDDVTSLEDGARQLLCSEQKIVRGSQGIALLANMTSLLANYAGTPSASNSDVSELRYKLKEGHLHVLNTTEKNPQGRWLTLEQVDASKVAPFLKRFRADTVEVQQIEPSRRKRNLP